MLGTPRGFVLYAVGLFVVLQVMLAGAIYWWPSFAENVAELKVIAAPLPMLGEMLDQIEEGGVAAYVVGQHHFKAINTVGLGAAIVIAAGAVASEAHRGTLELWLARPVSRRRLLAERYFGGLVATILPIFAVSLTVPWMLAWVDETMGVGDLLRTTAQASAFVAATYSLAFLWSTAASEPLRIVFVCLMVLVFQMAAYLVKVATDYSLFRIADVEEYMWVVLEDRVRWTVVVPLLAIAAGAYVLSQRVFAGRVP